MLIIGLLIVIVLVMLLLSKVLPIISGYGAKVLCSGVFVGGRESEDIVNNELASFPVSLGRFTCDIEKAVVTASVFGLAIKQCQYIDGLGAVLLNGITATELNSRLLYTAVAPALDQEKLPWPIGNLTGNPPAATTFNISLLNAAIDEAFTEPKNEVRRTRAVIVLYKGEIVAERYATGFSKDSRLAGWSLAKSVTNALIGILVRQGKIDVNSPAPIESWKNDNRSRITIANLLQMNSGLRWWEYYAAPSDVTNMLYNEKDMGLFALQKPLRHQPGKRFNYSSGSTNILSYIIRQTLGDHDYYRFPYEQLFYKTGMLSALLEADAGGTFTGSSYCHATARDWARFGLLYFNDGICNGERILPKGWVTFTTAPAAAKSSPAEGSYGALWWLNTAQGGTAKTKKYPAVPADCFRCQGHEGQYIWVIPSEELVVVRLALEKNKSLDPNVFLPAVIRAFR